MDWRKSKHSGSNGSCVEVASTDGVMVRDTTQNGLGPVVTFTVTAWQEFLSQVK